MLVKMPFNKEYHVLIKTFYLLQGSYRKNLQVIVRTNEMFGGC